MRGHHGQVGVEVSVIGIIENLLNKEPWTDGALCTQVDPEAFFPEKGEQSRPAKKVCQRCDVRDQCLKFAMDNDLRYGVFGGLSARDRTKLRRAS
ncbi:WhiB family transcriptional regulator [Mycolicibacterium neoaurum]|uniref:WhiB family transcriptional regulator n=1 Tax=Mycolicibacterium neoaurum TaxID=1795 RepID=UPI00296F945C